MALDLFSHFLPSFCFIFVITFVSPHSLFACFPYGFNELNGLCLESKCFGVLSLIIKRDGM
ncbi:hypothetical protein L873DRAFT_1808071 [Choiromyces venosus 120613-1]|uniref:Uncharacterized protein n=1 Tax=Choiromyces venosus 120613-1 TaxID=1336337 RepID=A0A3N4JMC9_9PEZI|nr:hypothetical protein L873DRAFT_1808071 [Choiromyces venosus 120613-1]